MGNYVWHDKDGKEVLLTAEQQALDAQIVRNCEVLAWDVSKGLNVNGEAHAEMREFVFASIDKLPDARAKHHLTELAAINVRAPAKATTVVSPAKKPEVAEAKK